MKKVVFSLGVLSTALFLLFQNATIPIIDTNFDSNPDVNNSYGYDVILVAGQSNAVGTGFSGANFIDKSDRSLDTRIFQLGRYSVNDQKIIPAQDVLENWGYHPGTTAMGYGFAMSFARAYVKNYPLSNRKVLIVPTAKGGSGVSSWQPGSLLYEDMRSRLQVALRDPRSRLVAVLWHQGEADVANVIKKSETHQEYVSSLKNIFVNLRKNFSNQGAFPILMGDLAPSAKNDYQFKLLPDSIVDIQNAMREVAGDANVAPSFVVKTDGQFVNSNGVADYYIKSNFEDHGGTRNVVTNGNTVTTPDYIHLCASSAIKLGELYYNQFSSFKNSTMKKIAVTRSLTLDSSANYDNTIFQIRGSKLTLDCNGLTLDNSSINFNNIDIPPYFASAGMTMPSSQSGLITKLQNNPQIAENIVADLKANKLRNIKIQNCTFTNNAYTPIILENRSPNITVRNLGLKLNEQQMIDIAPSNITLSNINIRNSGTGGVYVGDHSNYVTLDGVNIKNVGGIAVYLELGSKYTTIRDSIFKNNGSIAKREAVAIDTSANNIIERNTFANNYAGAIQLYKNCVERPTPIKDPITGIAPDVNDLIKASSSNYYPRPQHSDYNMFRYNTFAGESFGIHIAARQAINLWTANCEEAPIFDDESNGIKIHPDYSEKNFIYGNTFTALNRRGVGIRVESDNNLIIANSFEGMAGSSFLRVGSKSRVMKDQQGNYIDSRGGPLQGNTVINNTIKINGGGSPYLFGYASQGIACNNHISPPSTQVDRNCLVKKKNKDGTITNVNIYDASSILTEWSSRYQYMGGLFLKSGREAFGY